MSDAFMEHGYRKDEDDTGSWRLLRAMRQRQTRRISTSAAKLHSLARLYRTRIEEAALVIRPLSFSDLVYEPDPCKFCRIVVVVAPPISISMGIILRCRGEIN